MACRLLALVAFAFAVASAHAQAPAAPLMTLRVLAFDGGWNLPLWAAQRNGSFEAEGLAVQLTYTPSSGFLVASVLDGKSDIAFAAIDNVIAYQEGQGEAKVADNPDLFAFMGGDGGFISIVAAPTITSVKELKGRTVSVDAMTTGFAFVIRELVTRSGLAEADVTFVRAGGTANRYRDLVAGKHDATLLRTPFELLAEARGYHTIAAAETLGAYQGTVGLARRGWAREHEALLVANIRDMSPALAERSYDLLLADKGGLSRDLKPDTAGIATVLQLRSKYAAPAKALTDPQRYVDFAYYDKAFTKR